MSDNTRLVGLKKDKNDELYKELFVTDSKYRLISSSPKVFSAIHPDDFNEEFYISEDELNSYVDGFIQAVTDNSKKIIESITQNTDNNDNIADSALNDVDVKLSLYRSFKSLYDKWISCSVIGSDSTSGNTSGYFYNNYGSSSPSETRMLYEHFSFVNRGNGDVGKKAVIDFSYLSNLASTKNGQGPTQSLYESITNLLTKNNFEFFAMPNVIGYSTGGNEVLENIFRAFDSPIDRIPAKPGFVCMFIGGNSRTLDIPKTSCSNNGINFDYVDDTFDIDKPTTYPEDFIKNGGITAFKVRYGQQTQNHFKSLELDQSEFKETQESLLVIDALTNPSSGSDPSQIGKGNNIYDMYLTRNYSCTVNTFGNMQIQPMMVFKLENVPMYKGTYLITNVTHSIKPHNVETTFKGVRQPIVTVPIVTEALSLIDLALAETLQGDAALVNTSGGGGGTTTTTLPANQIFIDDTVYGDSSNEQCPKIDGITDGGVGDAYTDGKLFKIRLCKVKGALINVKMAENLNNMVNAAQADGVDLRLGSNFRTMQGQIDTAKENGCYKSGEYVKGDCYPDTATPGRSKHQSGYAIDFKCGISTICHPHDTAWCTANGATSRPNEYVCFTWMVNNASKYGFINYKGEAWHWSIDGT